MPVRSIDVSTSKRPISWGLQGENNATQLIIDVKDFYNAWPDGSPALLITRQDGHPYLAAKEQWLLDPTTTNIVFTLSATETELLGRIELVVSWSRTNGSIAKSKSFLGFISGNPSSTGLPLTPSTIIALDNLKEAVEKATSAADRAEATEGSILNKLDIAGGTMTGVLTLNDNSKAASEAVVDTKIATAIGSAGHLKRQIVEELPAVESADKDTIYLIKDASITSGDAYKEYMLIEGALVQIGDTSVNLEPYAKKVAPAAEDNIAILAADGSLKDGGKTIAGVLTDVDTKLEGFVAKEDGKSLVADAQIEKLAGLANIKSIGDNLTLSEDGVLAGTAEYTLPVATSEILGGVKIGQGVAATEEGVLSAKVVVANGLSLGDNGIAMGLASADAAGAMSAEMFTKVSNIAENAQVNVIEGALIGGAAATINEAKQIGIPVAGTAFGVVKSSEADNGVAVAADGTMSVNKVGVSKLFVETGNELILNGGTAEA